MNAIEYIAAIQKNLIKQYGMRPRADAPGIPEHVPDGVYPMQIEGRTDHVRIEGGKIFCCNYEPPT